MFTGLGACPRLENQYEQPLEQGTIRSGFCQDRPAPLCRGEIVPPLRSDWCCLVTSYLLKSESIEAGLGS
jgi:hypothetical protein